MQDHATRPSGAPRLACPALVIVRDQDGDTPSRSVFTCNVTAADVNYPFEAVVEPASAQVIYCEVDAPPPGLALPTSQRCT